MICDIQYPVAKYEFEQNCKDKKNIKISAHFMRTPRCIEVNRLIALWVIVFTRKKYLDINTVFYIYKKSNHE